MQVKTLDHKPPMTQVAFDASVFEGFVNMHLFKNLLNRLAQSVKDAILEGIHPKMITKGSSGSYFARAKVDGRVQTVAQVLPPVTMTSLSFPHRVFKPKDEEPYGRLNPKVITIF